MKTTCHPLWTTLTALFALSQLLPYSQALPTSSYSSGHYGIVQRDQCNPYCRPGTRLDTITYPACTWTCVSWSSSVINNSGAVVGAAATLLIGILSYTATRAKNSQQEQTGRRDLNESTEDTEPVVAFWSLLDSLGISNTTESEMWKREDNNITIIAIDEGNLSVNLTINEFTAEIVGSEFVLYPTGTTAGDIIDRRTDTLTNIRIVFHNALVDNAYQVRSYSYNERNVLANHMMNNYAAGTSSQGRAECFCLRSGQGSGFSAAITVEGQANNNGKYQAMSCDCDTYYREL